MIKGSDVHVLRTLCLCYSQELALKKSSDFLYANTDFIQSGLRIAVFKVKFAWSLDNY